MAKKYTTVSTSKHTAEILESLVLSETKTTRKVVRAKMIRDNPRDPNAAVSMSIIHQRAATKGVGWVDLKDPSLATIKAGEMRVCHLDSGETLNLSNFLNDLFSIHIQKGVKKGFGQVVVADASEVIQTSPERTKQIRELISKGYSEEVWQQLVDANPDLATTLSLTQLHHHRQSVLLRFSKMLQADTAEKDWKLFFAENTWIFGYGLDYRVLGTFVDQPNYGGSNVFGKGQNRGDSLQLTQGNKKFTVLVEIKKPSTQLLEINEYRNGVFRVGPDVLGGVSQLRGNSRQWELEGVEARSNREILQLHDAHTVQPKKILVVGDLKQLTTPVQAENFEMFRRNQSDVEILTFDELHERTRFILANADVTTKAQLAEDSFKAEVEEPF